MAMVERKGHGKVLAHFGNLAISTKEVLNGWIDVLPLNKSFKGFQKANLD